MESILCTIIKKILARNPEENLKENLGDIPKREISRTKTIKTQLDWNILISNTKARIIRKIDSINDVFNLVKEVGICAIDTETTGLDHHSDCIKLIQIAVPKFSNKQRKICNERGTAPSPNAEFKVFLIPLEDNESKNKICIDLLVDILTDEAITVIMQNAKFDLGMIRHAYGKRFITRNLFDTMIASQLITAGNLVPGNQWDAYMKDNYITFENVGNSGIYKDRAGHQIKFSSNNQKDYKVIYVLHNLYSLALRHLGIELNKDFQKEDWSKPLTEEMKEYAKLDVIVLLPLYEIFNKVINELNIEEVAKLEFDCIQALCEIEYSGFNFDSTTAKEIRDKLNGSIQSISDKMHNSISKLRNDEYKKINLNSSSALLKVIKEFAHNENIQLNDDNEFVFECDDGIEKIKLSTKDDSLIIISSHLDINGEFYKFISLLRTYRTNNKKLTFVHKYINKIHPQTNRIHGSVTQLNYQGVGRISASNPSLQQVPNDKSIRGLFTSPNGYKLIIADYSTIEMRIIAKLSGDVNLSNAFINQIDVHSYTASNVLNKPMKEISTNERKAAKAINFGLIYGMAATSLKNYAQTSYGVTLTTEESNMMRDKFFELYCGIGEWHEKQKKHSYSSLFGTYTQHNYYEGYFIEKRPYTRTLGNRLRVWATEQKISRYNKKYIAKFGSATELYNTPCQGTGADMIKKAMVLLYEHLVTNDYDDVKLLGTIHDELILEVPEKQAEIMKDKLESIMIDAGKFYLDEIPVEVEAKIAQDWSDK